MAVVVWRLTEPSEQVMTCLNVGLYTTACMGSLCVIGISACNTGL